MLSNIGLLVDAAGGYSSRSRQNFDISSYESRFSELRKDIPRDGVIGYLTDADPNLTSTSAEYYLAQYALSPAVVANNIDQKLVMANVHAPQPPAFYQSRGLDLVRDYRDGVMLLQKTAP